MVAEGHEVANHTYSHPHLTEITPDEMRSEVWSTEYEIVKAASIMPRAMLRPPFGSYDESVRAVLGALGYELIFWSIDSGDWKGFTPEQIIARAGTAKAGDIFVAHAYAANTGQAIGGICETLKGKGLRGGTVSQALGR